MKMKKMLLLPTMLLVATSLVGCGGKQAEFIDYTHNGSIKLTLDYKNHNFYTDGIEQVSLKSTIDGDTAHFTPASGGEVIKSRFYGIDTPESTGKIQEWGKPASNFTKEKLKNAAENGTIVVGSPSLSYCKPTPDSTGSRYVSLIWINETKKDAPYDELYLLNLWIVQEGFSWVKSLSDMPSYVDTFVAAESQAKAFKKNMHSGEPDPLFNYGDYKDVSLQELQTEVIACIKDPDHVNAYAGEKVRIQGTVVGFSSHILYLQDFFPTDPEKPQEGGVYCGINVFTGMSTISSKFTTKNNYIQLCGVAEDSENFGFQITGANFPSVAYDENDAKVVIYSEDNTGIHQFHEFTETSAELSASINNKKYTELNCGVSITDELTCYSAYESDTNHYFTLSLKNANGDKLPFDIYVTFNYKGDPDNPSHIFAKEDYVGSKFKLEHGVFTTHQSSTKYYFQLNPSKTSDLSYLGKAE